MESLPEFIFQGEMFLLEREKMICRHQASFRDPIDADVLQEALNALMRHTDYFNLKLICEEERFSLIPNDAPCEVCFGNEIRRIPEDTNGYLFYVSYTEHTVYFTYWHFLTDGRGGTRFLNELIKEYCNRKYGEKYVCSGLYTDREVSLEELKKRYGETIEPSRRQNIPKKLNGELRRYIVRVSKESVVRAAVAKNVKPFSYLLYALSGFARKQYGEKPVAYSYPIDARNVIGVPNALYNCVCEHRGLLDLEDRDSLIEEINRQVLRELDSDLQMKRFIQTNQICSDIYRMDKPLRERKILYDLVFRMTQSHFTLSYLGNPIPKEIKSVEKYLTDYMIGIIDGDMQIFFAETTFGDSMNFCVIEKTGEQDFMEKLKAAFTEENVDLVSVEELLLKRVYEEKRYE